jgi:hypothetical protein
MGQIGGQAQGVVTLIVDLLAASSIVTLISTPL